MPEGHILHRIAREHRDRFVGPAVAVTSPQGRFTEAARLDGRPLRTVEAYGKHLFYEFDGRRYVHVHLGLFGRMVSARQPALPPRPTTRMRLQVADWYADLVGPTRCQLLDGDQRSQLLSRLGPDPLRRLADPERAWSRIARSGQPIGALLADQSVVAGIGNVFRAELLFRAGIAPHRPGRSVGHDEWLALWADTRALMRAGVKRGRIVTTDPGDRSRRHGSVQPEDQYYVYRRAGLPCRRCSSPVRAEEVGGRRLYWCPACQSA